jgi:hypothetical protein
VERLQIDHPVSLAHAPALSYVVAWRLLYLTLTASEASERSAADLLEPEELAVLKAATEKAVETAAEAVIAIAGFAGYQPYRTGPPPGSEAAVARSATVGGNDRRPPTGKRRLRPPGPMTHGQADNWIVDREK